MVKGFWIGTRRFTIFVLAAFIILISRGAASKAIAAGSESRNLVSCDIQQGACTKDLDGMSLTLDILPKPVKAMKKLKFRVTLSGGKVTAAPYIDLGMPGMDMGPNRVELRLVKDNGYEGEGVIVRCPSGRRTWKARVTLPEVGEVEFLFDVIY
jgi:hypothetical protein